jgi:hypothetical protein
MGGEVMLESRPGRTVVAVALGAEVSRREPEPTGVFT